MKIWLSNLRARFERWVSPNLGTCYRCKRPWIFPATRIRWSKNDAWWKTYKFPRRETYRVSFQLNRPRFWGLVGVKSHSTRYSESEACFPLCEECWSILTPYERLSYYDALIDEWIRQMPSEKEEYEKKRQKIAEAVLYGK